MVKVGRNLTSGPVFKKYVLFVVPIILSSFLQQIYNTADAMIVGKCVGDEALAAVGSTSTITNLMLNLFIGISVGSNVVCARYYGAQNMEGLSRAIHTSVFLGVVLGVPLALVGWFCSGYFLGLMETPGEIIGQATIYMQICFLGTPATLVYNFGAAILRASGDTKRPLYILMASGVINIILNLVCVIFFNLGVIGVALATIASQIFSALIVVRLLTKTDEEIKLKASKIYLHKKELINMLAIGIPTGLNGILFSISNVLIQSSINTFGKDTVAGCTASVNIEAFGFYILTSSEQAIVSFVGQNVGAGKLKRADTAVWDALVFGFVTVGVFVLAVILVGESLISLFVSGEAAIREGIVKLNIVAVSYILFVPTQVLSGALRGMGKAVLPTMISAVFICFVRVIWVTVFLPLNPVINMVYYSYPITWIISGAAMILGYLTVRNREFKKIKNAS